MLSCKTEILVNRNLTVENKLAILELAGDVRELQEQKEQPKPIEKHTDCADIQKNGATESGIYTIYITPHSSSLIKEPLEVYCDLTTNGGGWSTFLRRVDGNWDFPNRHWEDYTQGFGSLNGSFWMGNQYIHQMTRDGKYRLRVDLMDWEGEKRYAEYQEFFVRSEDDKFSLFINGYSGSAGDSLQYHNGSMFSTIDKDNDKSTHTHCARHYKAGWWHNNCHQAQLTGEYLHAKHNKRSQGIVWRFWKKNKYSYKVAEMKFRPANFPN